jgi:hypothetical protein
MARIKTSGRREDELKRISAELTEPQKQLLRAAHETDGGRIQDVKFNRRTVLSSLIRRGLISQAPHNGRTRLTEQGRAVAKALFGDFE